MLWSMLTKKIGIGKALVKLLVALRIVFCDWSSSNSIDPVKHDISYLIVMLIPVHQAELLKSFILLVTLSAVHFVPQWLLT